LWAFVNTVINFAFHKTRKLLWLAHVSLLSKTLLCEVSFQGKAVLTPNDVMIFMITQEKERCGG